MTYLFGAEDRRVRREHEVDARVRDEIRLELRDVDVEGPVEPERRREARDDLGDQPVQVGVRGTLDAKVAAADVVQGLVVEAEGAVRVLQQGVGAQDGVVRLDDGRADARGRRHGEAQLGLAPVVDAQPLEEQAPEPGSRSSARGMEDQKS